MTNLGETSVTSVNEARREAKAKFNLAVLCLESDDSPRRKAERRILEALHHGDVSSVASAYDELAQIGEPENPAGQEKFPPFPYEMSEEDLFRLREFLAEKRLEGLRINGLVRSTFAGSQEKPRFIFKNPGRTSEADFELFTASYKHGRAILLAHPEYNNGWGCAIAIGWETNEGVAEVNRIDFSDYPDVLMSAMPLLKKYEID